MTESLARRMVQLVEPIAVVTYMADEPTEAVMALGLPSMWDAYFAGRAAPLGRDVPAAGRRRGPRLFSPVSPRARPPATSHGCGTRSRPRTRTPPGNGALSPHF